VNVPRRYTKEFVRGAFNLVEAGKPVVEITIEPGLSGPTICNWRSQDQIDGSGLPRDRETGGLGLAAWVAGGHDGLVLDRAQPAEGGLLSASVVAAVD
jgi:hypothetical protein